MLKTAKNNVKSIVRSRICALRDDRFRKALKKSPESLLPVFDHPAARDRYAAGGKPLPPRHWDIEPGPKGQMTLHGVDCLKLAEMYGTPLYVVDRSRLRKNYEEFRDGFARIYPRVEIAYSLRTNPLPGVLCALHEIGADVEAVSGFELWLASRLGISGERIVYNGTGKTREDLELAVSRNVKLITIDGLAEMGVIDRLAGRHGCRQQVGVRVNAFAGREGKFGFCIGNGSAFEAYRHLKGLKSAHPVGMHTRIESGEGAGGPDEYARAAREMLRLAKALKEKLDISIRYFGFGGGFGAVGTVRQYGPVEQKLLKANLPVQEARLEDGAAPAAYGKAVVDVFTGNRSPDMSASPPTIVLEPGKAITCSAMFALVKVLDITSPENGIRDVIVDGGRSFAAPLGWECHELLHATRLSAAPEGYCRILGPTCTLHDVLYRVKRVPSLKRGDILAIMDAGAYFVPMQTNFSFPRAAAVMVDRGSHRLIRERERYEDIVGKDIFPDSVRHPSAPRRV